jgi:asparagine synthase (glutamine-hydrolysing)
VFWQAFQWLPPTPVINDARFQGLDISSAIDWLVNFSAASLGTLPPVQPIAHRVWGVPLRLSAAAGQKRAGRAAWNLLFYTLWHRRHIERFALPPDTAEALVCAG